jgi:alcohol dehydrogenase class IV
VLEVVEECRRVKADLLITIGGGSLTDAAKLVALVCDAWTLHSLTDE